MGRLLGREGVSRMRDSLSHRRIAENDDEKSVLANIIIMTIFLPSVAENALRGKQKKIK